MAFHIPFNQRASAPKPAPVYIGFEVPRPPRKKFNWWGFNGMWMSFASLFTAGFASPVPLLISLVGLRRPGKKMASVGTFISTLGVAMAATIVIASVASHNHHVEATQMARYNRIVKKQLAENDALMAITAIEIAEYRTGVENDQNFDIKANVLIIENEHVDPWGKALRFEPNSKDGLVRSAGPDKEFDTRDDVTLEINRPEEEVTSVPKELTPDDDLANDDF